MPFLKNTYIEKFRTLCDNTCSISTTTNTDYNVNNLFNTNMFITFNYNLHSVIL